MTTTVDRMSGAAAPAVPARRPLPGRLRYVVFGGTAAILALLDQATKVLAVEVLTRRGTVDVGSDGTLAWELVRNTNAAFGIPGFTGMFLLVTVIVLVLIAKALPRTDRLWLTFAYGLVAGGALGNSVDRVARVPGFPGGGVVDFIKIGWWPNFNLADSGIVIGAVLIALLLWLVDREERAVERAREQAVSVRPGGTGPQG